MSMRRPNSDGTAATQRKDGIWYRTVVIDGKRKYVYGKSKAAVNRKFRKLKERKPEALSKKLKRMTVEDYLMNWLTVYKKVELKPKSYDTLESTILHQIAPYFKGHRFFTLTHDDIQKFINMLDGEGCSYSIIRKAYLALNAYCKFAIATDDLSKNPCLMTKLPKKADMNVKSIQVLSKEQIKVYCEHATERYGNGKSVCRLGYGLVTGLRLGEAAGLIWDDIDFQKRTLKVQRTPEYVKNRSKGENENHYVPVEGTTKSKSSERTIPLNQTALDALLELKKANGGFDHVFSNAKGKPVNPRNLNRAHDCILERTGIEHIGIHALRHTFASQLFANKVDIKIISNLLGHSEISVTYNIYIHLMQDDMSDATTNLDTLLDAV